MTDKTKEEISKEIKEIWDLAYKRMALNGRDPNDFNPATDIRDFRNETVEEALDILNYMQMYLEQYSYHNGDISQENYEKIKGIFVDALKIVLGIRTLPGINFKK
jgi:hypothetical protein